MSNTLPTAKKPLRQVASVRELLVNDQALAEIKRVATAHMNPERMARIVLSSLRQNPKLGECDPLSLLGALMTCAQMGLEPATPLGHAYLVPFANKVTLILGYKGYLDLARRNKSVVSVHADVHYSDDAEFECSYGSGGRLRHRPGPKKGTLLGAYVYVRLTDGEAYTYMTLDEIISIRDRSQGWQSAVKFGKTALNPWTTHLDMMARKTAIRRLAQGGEMPMTTELALASTVDDERVDYAAMTADPDLGPIIEGESEPETETPEAPPASAPEPQRSRPEPTKAPARKTAEADDPFSGVIDRILGEIAEAGDVDTLDACLDMWDDQIQAMRAAKHPRAVEIANAQRSRRDAINAEGMV